MFLIAFDRCSPQATSLFMVLIQIVFSDGPPQATFFCGFDWFFRFPAAGECSF